MSAIARPLQPAVKATTKTDETLLLFARLMEGGQEDEETCRDLDQLCRLLTEDAEANKDVSICQVIDFDCADTLLCYLDLRQPDIVRGHAILCIAAYLKASGPDGAQNLSQFFFDRVRRGTYDDLIAAFCVASSTFPVAPELTAQLFLSEGFLGSLGPLMRRKWKSRKVETACLEMLNAACMNPQCREAVEKYCGEWLEEVLDQDPSEVVRTMSVDPERSIEGGTLTLRRHSEQVQNLAAVILTKLRAVSSSTPSRSEPGPVRIEPATTSVEDLSAMFTKLLLREDGVDTEHSVEGLAYASLRPKVKESMARDGPLLKKLVGCLAGAPPKSPMTYGALSIFVNITKYQPVLSEEEIKMRQLKAYADAAGKVASSEQDKLSDDAHVSKRCRAVFDAGIVPVLVTHSKSGSAASLGLTIAIIYALTVTPALRGPLAQQGAVRLLLSSWQSLPESESVSRRTAAQAMARILISINPALVLGGNRATPVTSAIRPLLFILPPDATAETRDLLPTFEALMALTNLASLPGAGGEETRRAIIASSWTDVEDLLLSSNARVSKAAVELVCNIMQSPQGVALYADGSEQAKSRLNVLLALADAEDEGTRSAAGGALAELTAHEKVVQGILERQRGLEIVLGMCVDENESLRHRGGFVVCNMLEAEGDVGKRARERVKAENGIEVLKECAKKSRSAEVVEVTLQALKILVEGG